MYQHSLAGYEKEHDANHPKILDTLYGLTMRCENQGTYKEAETLYLRALSGYEQTLGEDHPSTLHTVRNLPC